MCKYCESVGDTLDNKIGYATKFRKQKSSKKGEKTKIGCIVNMQTSNIGWVISVKGENKNDPEDWYDFRINYCPRCGKRLREKLLRY